SHKVSATKILPLSIWWLVAAVLVLTNIVSIWAASGESATRDFYPVENVERGMKGYGLTTFGSNEVEKFPVEVLGILDGWTPGGKLVLIRMSSPELDKAGIIAGMSGSPVFIEDLPLGAVAYGFPFCKVPLAGVTPISEMREIGEIAEEQKTGTEESRKAHYRRILREKGERLARCLGQRSGDLSEQRLATIRSMLRLPTAELPQWTLDKMPGSVRRMLQGTGQNAMIPLPTPVAVRGLVSEVLRKFSPLMETNGFFPVQGAGAMSRNFPERKPLPGDPLGVVWISGDLDLSAMGTVTAVDGDKILAFGHPLMGSGHVNLPLALGRVEAIVPSSYRSFRLSSTGPVVGRLVEDRAPGISGRLGEKAPMFPVSVQVAGSRKVTFDYRVASYWEMAPMLAFYTTALSALRWEGTGTPITVTAQSQIGIEGREKPLILENTYSGFSPMAPAFELVWLPMESLVLNPFQETEIRNLKFKLDVKRGLKSAQIETLRLPRQKFLPGETITVWVRLREFQGDDKVVKMTLKVPEDARPGSTAQILVCDAFTARSIEAGLDPGFFAPDSFEDLLMLIEEVPQSTHLHLRASFIREGLRYDGEAMPHLPSSAVNILAFGSESGKAMPLNRDVKSTVKTPWVVAGAQSSAITIGSPTTDDAQTYR
ncbi:MAG: hypothetical protein ACLFWL_14745, partial [Candidatus Brocadiia bacterium]